MKPKLLYRAFSVSETIFSLISRLVCVVGLVYALAHYNENPVVITLFSLFCLMLIMILGDDDICVYTDRVVQSRNSFASILFKRKGNVLMLSQVKRAYLRNEKVGIAEIGVIVALMAILPNTRSRNNTTTIFFELEDGEITSIETSLGYNQVEKLLNTINSETAEKDRLKKSS